MKNVAQVTMPHGGVICEKRYEKTLQLTKFCNRDPEQILADVNNVHIGVVWATVTRQLSYASRQPIRLLLLVHVFNLILVM